MAAPRNAPLHVAFVPGVTPTKWERIWRERRPPGHIYLEPHTQADALAALDDGRVQMALLRDGSGVEGRPADEHWHAISLYRENPVVVAPRGSLVAGLDDITLAELTALDDVPVQLVDLMTSDGSEAIELVAANVGVAIMPQSVARMLSRKDVVARPLRDAPDTGISLVWPAANAHPLSNDFVGIVRGRTANSSR